MIEGEQEKNSRYATDEKREARKELSDYGKSSSD